MFDQEPLTDEETEQAWEMADGIPCPVCGRDDDWLAEGRRGEHVYLRCDDCMNATIRIHFPKESAR